MRFGILTGGGDCPGLNAVIRAIVRKGIDVHGHEIVGFRDGWQGPLERHAEPLTIESTRGILPRGGTILGTSRTNPFKRDDGPATIAARLRGARPRRPDRDRRRGHARAPPTASTASTVSTSSGCRRRSTTTSAATDVTFGFDTAVQVATEAIDRLHTTAESHHRVMVVEVMGRHAGWIALYSGIAGGGDVILIPERPFDIDAGLRADPAPPRARALLLDRRRRRGRAAEGGDDGDRRRRAPTSSATPASAGSATGSRREIEQRTGFETRAVVLGHIQRGGTPTAYDRVLATRFGVAAIDAADDGRWGTMPALRGHQDRARAACRGGRRAAHGDPRGVRGCAAVPGLARLRRHCSS